MPKPRPRLSPLWQPPGGTAPFGAWPQGVYRLRNVPAGGPSALSVRHPWPSGIACPLASPNRWMGRSTVQQTGRVSGTFGAVTPGTPKAGEGNASTRWPGGSRTAAPVRSRPPPAGATRRTRRSRGGRRRLARPARDSRPSRANQVTHRPRAPTHSATPGVHFQVRVVPQGAHRQQRAALASVEPVYGPLVAPVRPGARDDRLELVGRRS